ncbi:MAG: peptide-methionine (S)-S-oxide reductase MsrA [Brevundimonas sp.]
MKSLSRRILVAALAGPLVIAACSPADTAEGAAVQTAGLETAVFAGGCFWSVEHHFEQVPGVVEAVSGFTGGRVSNPGYLQVVRGGTGHVEAVRVTYDPARVSYRRLVDGFWRSIDPTDPAGQFCDRGPSYVTAVFATPEQREAAEASRRAARAALGDPATFTPVRAAERFWPAERSHQDYARRNPRAYQAYVRGCRRVEALRRVWGDA